MMPDAMINDPNEPLVDGEWLERHLGEPDLKVVDATWYMPGEGDPEADYRTQHISGAVRFDIDRIKDRSSDLPHMVPDAEAFAEAVGRLGIGEGDRVVVYDNNHFFASARVWWMFRLFGHDAVKVLDGGLKLWRAEDRPVEAGEVRPPPATFRARPVMALLKRLDEVRTNLETEAEQILDARSPGRFKGEEKEARPGVRSGHIPGSRNVHYAALLTPDARLKPAHELRHILGSAGVDLERPVVTSCGSGVSAALINLALYRLGRGDAALYDGSWTEWGGRADTPVAP